MPHAVFVNYRVSDEETTAALVASALQERFGPDQVFRASVSIRPSESFPERILTAVRAASVLLVIVGPRWLTAVDEAGQPRIQSETDWVRREIAEALVAAVRIVPVLVGTAKVLPRAELPDDIRAITDLQYLRLHHRNVDADLTRLVEELIALAPALADASSEGGPGAASPVEARQTGALLVEALDSAALTDGFLFLWSRLADLLARAEDGSFAAGMIQPAATAGSGGLDTLPGPLVADPEVVIDRLRDLLRLRAELTPYVENLGLIEPKNGSFLWRLAKLRSALESVFGQRLTLRGEEREPTGARIDVQGTIETIEGTTKDVRLRDTRGIESVTVVRNVKSVGAGGYYSGVEIGYEDRP